MALTFWYVDAVYADPCRTDRGAVAVGPSVNDLANALATQPRRHGTAPTDASLDGYAGKFVRVTVPEHIDFARCDQHQFAVWIGHELQGPGQHDELWILQVHGTRLVIDASYLPGASSADRAELRRMVRTVHFG